MRGVPHLIFCFILGSFTLFSASDVDGKEHVVYHGNPDTTLGKKGRMFDVFFPMTEYLV